MFRNLQCIYTLLPAIFPGIACVLEALNMNFIQSGYQGHLDCLNAIKTVSFEDFFGIKKKFAGAKSEL